MIPFPDISPELFSFNLGGFEIALRWYALSYIFGFVFAALIMRHFVRQTQLWRHNTPPMDIEQVDSLISYLVLGVIIGGRLGYVLFYNLDFYVENPSHILRMGWGNGISRRIYWCGVGCNLYCRFNGIPLMSGADLIALASPPGLMLGRIANFINAELWGVPQICRGESYFRVIGLKIVLKLSGNVRDIHPSFTRREWKVFYYFLF